MYSYTLMLEKWGNSHNVRVLNNQTRSFENRILEWVSISYFVKVPHFTIVFLNTYSRMRECGYYNSMSWDRYSSILKPKNIFGKSGNRCSLLFIVFIFVVNVIARNMIIHVFSQGELSTYWFLWNSIFLLVDRVYLYYWLENWSLKASQSRWVFPLYYCTSFWLSIDLLIWKRMLLLVPAIYYDLFVTISLWVSCIKY